MNAQEIVNELKTGKTVAILSDDAFEFMREVERHAISCEGIDMRFREGQCLMSIESHGSRLVAKDGHIVTPTGKKFRIKEANNI